MSDIAVRKLAEMINAPVEVLLKQLQDAGIKVAGPDARITNAEKMTLLAHIRQGNTAAGGANKITLTRRSTSEMTVGNATPGRGGAAAKTISVEVKRKKTFDVQQSPRAAYPSAPARTADAVQQGEQVSRTEALARKMDAERKVREAAIQKGEQARRETEARRMAAQKKPETELPEAPVPAPKADEITHSAPPAVQPETPIVLESTNAVVEAVPTVDVPPQPLPEQPAEALVAAVTPSAPVSEEPVAVSQPRTESRIRMPVAPRPESVAVTSNMNNLSAMEQREKVAAAAKEDAASALKRRPSRLKPKYVPTPAPVAAPVPEPVPPPVVETPPAPVAVEEVKADKVTPAKKEFAPSTNDDPAKKSAKKTGKNSKPTGRGGREELHLSTDNRHGKKRGGKSFSRPDPRQAQAAAKHGFEKPTAPVVKEIEIPPNIVVSDLAQKLAVRGTDVVKSLMKLGMMVTINQSIDQDTAILVTEEMGHIGKPMQDMDDAALLASAMDQTTDYVQTTRPPVVTIMGHVDHGKTSLLDYIRKTRVAAGEAGGITQHISSYHVDTAHGTVTFLDTPGHAAFTHMRARGANVTDIIVLIVAADDGVMPQTKEVIQHAKAAGVPLVVAINKIDKPAADPEKVLSELAQHDVLTTSWGGDVEVVHVSAKTGQGVDALLETLLLVAETLELKAPLDAPASGNVIEASIEKGRGAVATVLVRSGTLRRGDLILCGSEYGRVRALFDDTGRPTKEAGPSMPVAVLGLSAAPEAGDEIIVLTDERKAREIAAMRRENRRDTRFAAQNTAKSEDFFVQVKASERAQVNLLIKADVQGSVEALRNEVLKLSTDEVEVRVVAAGVGGISASDVDLAAASRATMVAFNVRADATARKIASESGVTIRYYSIIYEAIDDVKSAMSGLLAPEIREVFVGLAEVREVFRSSELGQVAGCLVVDGAMRKGNPIRVLRDSVVIYEGELESLRRHRDDVKEVKMGTECGIAVKDYNDVRAGDQIEVFERVEIARKV